MEKTLYLFDIDGTLLYSEKRDSQCFADSYESVFGLPFPTIDWSRFPEVTDHVIFRTAYHDHFNRYPTETERLLFEDHYTKALTQVRSEDGADFPPVPGALAYWERLETDPNAVIGVATGGWQRPQSIKLGHIGLPPTPPFSGYANGMSSRVDILQHAINQARAVHPIKRVVYFGDAVWDLITTRKMKIPFIGIRRDGDHHKFTDLGHQHVLTDFTDQKAVDQVVSTVIGSQVLPGW